MAANNNTAIGMDREGYTLCYRLYVDVKAFSNSRKRTSRVKFSKRTLADLKLYGCQEAQIAEIRQNPADFLDNLKEKLSDYCCYNALKLPVKKVKEYSDRMKRENVFQNLSEMEYSPEFNDWYMEMQDDFEYVVFIERKLMLPITGHPGSMVHNFNRTYYSSRSKSFLALNTCLYLAGKAGNIKFLEAEKGNQGANFFRALEGALEGGRCKTFKWLVSKIGHLRGISKEKMYQRKIWYYMLEKAAMGGAAILKMLFDVHEKLFGNSILPKCHRYIARLVALGFKNRKYNVIDMFLHGEGEIQNFSRAHSHEVMIAYLSNRPGTLANPKKESSQELEYMYYEKALDASDWSAVDKRFLVRYAMAAVEAGDWDTLERILWNDLGIEQITDLAAHACFWGQSYIYMALVDKYGITSWSLMFCSAVEGARMDLVVFLESMLPAESKNQILLESLYFAAEMGNKTIISFILSRMDMNDMKKGISTVKQALEFYEHWDMVEYVESYSKDLFGVIKQIISDIDEESIDRGQPSGQGGSDLGQMMGPAGLDLGQMMGQAGFRLRQVTDAEEISQILGQIRESGTLVAGGYLPTP